MNTSIPSDQTARRTLSPVALSACLYLVACGADATSEQHAAIDAFEAEYAEAQTAVMLFEPDYGLFRGKILVEITPACITEPIPADALADHFLTRISGKKIQLEFRPRGTTDPSDSKGTCTRKGRAFDCDFPDQEFDLAPVYDAVVTTSYDIQRGVFLTPKKYLYTAIGGVVSCQGTDCDGLGKDVGVEFPCEDGFYLQRFERLSK